MARMVLFDWDGTLIDSIWLWNSAYDIMRRRLGLPEVNSNRFSSQDKIPNSIINEKFKTLPETKKLVFDSWVEVYEKISGDVKLFPGSMNLLHRLKNDGYRLGLVTGGNKKRVFNELRRFGIRKFFDVIITADDLPEEDQKPSSKPLEMAMKKMSSSPKECVYVGDSDIDEIAAKNIEMKFIGIVREKYDLDTFNISNPQKVSNPQKAVSNFDELYRTIKTLK